MNTLVRGWPVQYTHYIAGDIELFTQYLAHLSPVVAAVNEHYFKCLIENHYRDNTPHFYSTLMSLIIGRRELEPSPHHYEEYVMTLLLKSLESLSPLRVERDFFLLSHKHQLPHKYYERLVKIIHSFKKGTWVSKTEDDVWGYSVEAFIRFFEIKLNLLYYNTIVAPYSLSGGGGGGSGTSGEDNPCVFKNYHRSNPEGVSPAYLLTYGEHMARMCIGEEESSYSSSYMLLLQYILIKSFPISYSIKLRSTSLNVISLTFPVLDLSHYNFFLPQMIFSGGGVQKKDRVDIKKLLISPPWVYETTEMINIPLFKDAKVVIYLRSQLFTLKLSELDTGDHMEAHLNIGNERVLIRTDSLPKVSLSVYKFIYASMSCWFLRNGVPLIFDNFIHINTKISPTPSKKKRRRMIPLYMGISLEAREEGSSSSSSSSSSEKQLQIELYIYDSTHNVVFRERHVYESRTMYEEGGGFKDYFYELSEEVVVTKNANYLKNATLLSLFIWDYKEYVNRLNSLHSACTNFGFESTTTTHTLFGLEHLEKYTEIQINFLCLYVKEITQKFTHFSHGERHPYTFLCNEVFDWERPLQFISSLHMLEEKKRTGFLEYYSERLIWGENDEECLIARFHLLLGYVGVEEGRPFAVERERLARVGDTLETFSRYISHNRDPEVIVPLLKKSMTIGGTGTLNIPFTSIPHNCADWVYDREKLPPPPPAPNNNTLSPPSFTILLQ